MPLNYAKVWNVCARETKDKVVIDYLLYITVEGTFKTTYDEGEIFDPNGILIKAHLADGSTTELTAADYKDKWKFYPNTPLTYETTHITIAYSYYNKTATVNVPVTVNKMYAKAPYIVNKTLYYNGQEQSPTIINEDSDIVILEGNEISGTDAGIYEITATITNPKYVFEETMSNTMTLTWEIEKAQRPISLSQDYWYLDTTQQGTEMLMETVYLNYPGDAPFQYQITMQSQGFAFSPYVAQKYIEVYSYNRNGSFRSEIEVYVKGDNNYLDSERVTFTAMTLYWDWDERQYADAEWFQGLINQIDASKPREEWIGKSKTMQYVSNVSMSGYLNKMYYSPVTIRCVDINRDLPDSVTFETEFLPSQVMSYVDKEDRPVNYNTDGKSFLEYYNEDNNFANFYDKLVWYAFFYESNDLEVNGLFYALHPGKQYLQKIKKIYWDGEDQKEIEAYGFIPSAAELGLTNDNISSYIGGQGIEYTEGVYSPYSYYINDSRRISRISNTNVPAKYWTRSTADDGEKARADDGTETKLNLHQIIVDENGQADIEDRDNNSNVRVKILFTIGLNREEGED